MNLIGRQSLLRTEPREPLHQALARELRRRIESGEWEPSSRVPSVRELAEAVEVSTVTAARAYRELAAAGILISTQGSGTYVAADVAGQRAQPARDTSWQLALLNHTAPRTRSVFSYGVHPADVISLASGGTAVDAFPLEWFQAEWRAVLARTRPEEYRFSAPIGYPGLRAWIAGYLQTVGIHTTADHILVTSGAQQAIFLTAQTLLRPGDVVLVERPAYAHGLAVFEALGVTCLEVPVDDFGLQVDEAADLMERFRPKLVFAVPTGQNPTGTVMPVERRKRLLESARRSRVVILEDDMVSEFTYDSPAPPAIKSFDYDGHVIYVRSFSKLVAPALRLGCVVADGPVFSSLVDAKGIADRFTSIMVQQAVLAYVTGKRFQRGLNRARETYRARRDAMLSALAAEMPPGVEWNKPGANWNVWLRLPSGVSAREVARRAATRGVLVAPDAAFFYRNSPDSWLRVTFSDNSAEVAREGVRRLGVAIVEVARELDVNPVGLHAGEVIHS